MKRDPTKEPRVGDKWKGKTSNLKWEIVSCNDKYEYITSNNDGVWFTRLDLINDWSKFAEFLGNDKEKEEMNNVTLTTVIILGKDFKENLTERERAITNPQAGDRWIWGDGHSIEVAGVEPSNNKKTVCIVSSSREFKKWASDSWRAFVHAAIFAGNFVPKTEKRNPKKNPQAGDRWQTTIFYHNNMYDGTTKGITAGSTLMISEVANRESDTFVYGYFTDGTKFICPMKEFEARTQSLKFVE